MKTKLFLSLLFSFLSAYASLAQTAEQVSTAGMPDYKMPAAAVAAGIDGRLAIGLTVNEDGKAEDLRIYSTPMWPCGARMPGAEIEEVKKTVKEHIRAAKFTPEIRDGKSRSVSAELTILLSDRFKGAASAPNRLYRPDIAEPGLVDVGVIQGRAETLRNPSKLVGTRGIIIMQILVNEEGKVTAAGVFKGRPELASAARDAVCESKFKPVTVKGKAVPMTGMLTYYFN